MALSAQERKERAKQRLAPRDIEIYGYIKQHPGCMAYEVAAHFGVQIATISGFVGKLRRFGLIEPMVPGKKRCQQPYWPTEKPLEDAVAEGLGCFAKGRKPGTPNTNAGIPQRYWKDPEKLRAIKEGRRLRAEKIAQERAAREAAKAQREGGRSTAREPAPDREKQPSADGKEAEQAAKDHHDNPTTRDPLEAYRHSDKGASVLDKYRSLARGEE